jgi:hypothetical protein
MENETELQATNHMFNINLDQTFNRSHYLERKPEEQIISNSNTIINSNRQFNPNQSINLEGIIHSQAQPVSSLRSTNFSNMEVGKFSMSSWV